MSVNLASVHLSLATLELVDGRHGVPRYATTCAGVMRRYFSQVDAG